MRLTEGRVEKLPMGKYNLLKDYTGRGDVQPAFTAESTHHRVAIPWKLYKQLKANLLNHGPDCCEKRMIRGRRPRKSMEVKFLNCLNILSSGQGPERDEYVAYMAEENGRYYFLKICKTLPGHFCGYILEYINYISGTR